MQALHEHGPLVVGMNWYHAWEDLGSDGIMTDSPGSKQDGGHCVLLVGYSKTKNAFRLRNSWGSDWADGGYSWLPFDMAHHLDDAYLISI
jgi:C1A family cysteine protease